MTCQLQYHATFLDLSSHDLFDFIHGSSHLGSRIYLDHGLSSGNPATTAVANVLTLFLKGQGNQTLSKLDFAKSAAWRAAVGQTRPGILGVEGQAQAQQKDMKLRSGKGDTSSPVGRKGRRRGGLVLMRARDSVFSRGGEGVGSGRKYRENQMNNFRKVLAYPVCYPTTRQTPPPLSRLSSTTSSSSTQTPNVFLARSVIET
jgi:hypothetical protein